ncbi:FmdE family protein [Algoriphagus sp.]|uniref:FmdE family protein n=1 Tax=Algoriphagus sp. TaxID=1872435 RepID=UPI00391CCFD5
MKIIKFLNTSLFLLSLSFAQAQVKHAGSMSEMGKTGFASAIALDTLKPYKGLVALGPLGKMEGEITVVDGIPYAGIANPDASSVVQKNWKMEAPFLVYADVKEWQEFKFSGKANSQQELEASLEAAFVSAGMDLSKPFPFRVIGIFDQMITHIVTPRSPEIAGYKDGRNQVNYTHLGEEGELIGFYSREGKGIYTHQNSYFHIHFLNEAKSFAGHLDKFESSLEGFKIWVPKAHPKLSFRVIDTDFSKGRLGFQQEIELNDLVKFHGHLCDGLVVGTKALNYAFAEFFSVEKIDRTDYRIISGASPCLADAASYLTGARLQFGTQLVSPKPSGLFLIERISDGKAVQVNLKPEVKPQEIIFLTALAEQGALSPCEMDHLKKLEDQFSIEVLASSPVELYTLHALNQFEWVQEPFQTFKKTDILNKNLAPCLPDGGQ